MPLFQEQATVNTRGKLRNWAKANKLTDYVVLYHLIKWANDQDGVGTTGLLRNMPDPDVAQAAQIEAVKAAVNAS